MSGNKLLIKVCGMRDAENICEAQELGADLIGMIFWDKSPRNVPWPPRINGAKVGVFVDEMPQTILSYVYNLGLSYVQLHGNESRAYVDNLRSTLVPDIAPDVKIIKALSIREADDVKRWREYDGVADMLLFDTKCTCVGGSGEQFDWSVLEHYDGNIPFLLSGGIGPDDAERVKAFHHPMLAGIDLNSRFEIEPGYKDLAKLRKFIEELKQPN